MLKIQTDINQTKITVKESRYNDLCAIIVDSLYSYFILESQPIPFQRTRRFHSSDKFCTGN